MTQLRRLMVLLVPAVALVAAGCTSSERMAANPPPQPAPSAPGSVEGYGGLQGRVGAVAMIRNPDGRMSIVEIKDPAAVQELMTNATPLTGPTMMLTANGRDYMVNANAPAPNGETVWDYFKGAAATEGYGGAKGRVGSVPMMMAMMPDGRVMTMPVSDPKMVSMAMHEAQPVSGATIMMMMGDRSFMINPMDRMPNGETKIEYLNQMAYGHY